jgi:hypothetical protein
MFAIQFLVAYYRGTMLLVTFHGGSVGTNNIYGYSTKDGTHTKGTGSISKFAVTHGSPPTLLKGETFTTTGNDTPEFCLWVSDSNWPG